MEQETQAQDSNLEVIASQLSQIESLVDLSGDRSHLETNEYKELKSARWKNRKKNYQCKKHIQIKSSFQNSTIRQRIFYLLFLPLLYLRFSISILL